MRLVVAAAALCFVMSGTASAEDLACVSTTFNLLSPNDKVCVSGFDDPKVPGVTCFISQARKGGWGQPLGLNEDPSNFSVVPSNRTDHRGHCQAAREGGSLQREDQHLLQEDAHLSHSRCAKKYHRVSRRQLEDHRGFARERGQCRAHYVVAKITIRASLAYSLMFSATAARMSALNALSSILSPSWKSMARLTLPSRLELNRPEGSSNEAPLAKVSFTTAL